MPSVNPYNYEEIHDKKLAESICVAAVVKVLNFDKDKMTVNVQPLSKHLENGNYETPPPVLQVPVGATHTGGFIFRPWIKEGDVGVVVYLDHDMDSTVTGGKEAKPLTERNHSTSDAVFIGGIVSGGYTAQGLPDEAHIIAKEDGTIYVAVTMDKVAIKNGDTTADFTADAIDIKATAVNITADVHVTGEITATKDMIAESRISGAHHMHPGCSGGSTGQPQ